MSEITKKQIKSLGWTEPPKAATNAGQHDQLSRLRTIAIRAEEAMNTTRLVVGRRRATQLSNTNSAFMMAPTFAATVDEENEAGTALPPLPEVQVARPPGPPPNSLDGPVKTGLSTPAADRTIYTNVQILMNQPVPQATLREEARAFKSLSAIHSDCCQREQTLLG